MTPARIVLCPPVARFVAGAAAIFAAVLLLSTSGIAERRFSLETTPGKLPKTVVPIHYAIELSLDPDNLKVTGFETIDIEVREPTARIVLNANRIKLSHASADNGTQTAAIAANPGRETMTLTFPRALSAGRHTLAIAFTAPINTEGPGLYAVDYRTEHGVKRLISSHFAPGDARRLFPLWDEPAFKATFALTVSIPRALQAVSNMPIAREEPAAAATKRITFAPTPTMSSYLLALTVGELETITGDADGVAVRVVTVRGKSEQGRFALAGAIELLRYMNGYFGVKYPLPKLDLIAVPSGHVSAMEHWGAITFREDRLLLDATSGGTARRAVFRIVAHELAHQWFGNLATMAWWDDLWLNEGFATWMEAKATEHFHPRWQTWLDDTEQKQMAMNADARGSAHPIHQPVADENEAAEMFDNITYNKAAAVVRMLEGYVGEAAFQRGIRQYMRAHAYDNATGADFWHALEEAAGKPVAAVAKAFISQRGVPLVVAQASCAAGEQHVTLRQERFTARPAGRSAGPWQVPVTAAFPGATEPAGTLVLQERPTVIAAGRCGDPVNLNPGDIGYYRVEYDGAMRAALVRAMARLLPADRVSLLADTWALVEAGRMPPASYFDLLENVAPDDSPPVWSHILRTLQQIDQAQRDRPERAAFRAYARAKLRPVLAEIGWDSRNRGDGAGALRPRLIRFLGEIGDQDVLAEARRRFADYQKDASSLRPGLRETVLYLAVIGGSKSTDAHAARRSDNAASAAELRGRALPGIDAWIRQRAPAQ
jgi:aminopeptidase N